MCGCRLSANFWTTLYTSCEIRHPATLYAVSILSGPHLDVRVRLGGGKAVGSQAAPSVEHVRKFSSGLSTVRDAFLYKGIQEAFLNESCSYKPGGIRPNSLSKQYGTVPMTNEIASRLDYDFFRERSCVVYSLPAGVSKVSDSRQ